MKPNFFSLLVLVSLFTFIQITTCQIYDSYSFQNFLKNSDDNFAQAYRSYETQLGSNLRFLSEDQIEQSELSEQCRMRPNNIYSEPFGFIPTLLGKLHEQGDVSLFIY
jgi:hypothetical protein